MNYRTHPTSAAVLVALLAPLAGCNPAANNTGTVAPSIQVAGWVNGSPDSNGLTGQVTVIDFGASS